VRSRRRERRGGADLWVAWRVAVSRGGRGRKGEGRVGLRREERDEMGLLPVSRESFWHLSVSRPSDRIGANES
jgi:hypothetical protein